MLFEGQILTPVELLKEIEAFFCFNVNPTYEDIRGIKKSINDCLDMPGKENAMSEFEKQRVFVILTSIGGKRIIWAV